MEQITSGLFAKNEAPITIKEVPYERPDTKHQYKPLAIRLPSLICFLFLFAACIGSIEFLLSLTLPPTATGSKEKRQEPVCDDQAYSSESSSLIAASTSLCAEFRTRYEDSWTSLPTSLQDPFQTWRLNFDNLLEQQSTLQRCAPWGIWLASPTSTVWDTVVMTATPTPGTITSSITTTRVIYTTVTDEPAEDTCEDLALFKRQTRMPDYPSLCTSVTPALTTETTTATTTLTASPINDQFMTTITVTVLSTIHLRQKRTPQTDAYGATPPCSISASCSRAFSTLETSYTDLCSSYSSIFGPSPGSLNLDLQSSFAQFHASFASITAARTETSLDCFVRNQPTPTSTSTASSSGNYTLTIEEGQYATYMTAGCNRTLITFSFGCWGTADVYLSNGRIETSAIAVCGPATADFMTTVVVPTIATITFRDIPAAETTATSYTSKNTPLASIGSTTATQAISEDNAFSEFIPRELSNALDVIGPDGVPLAFIIPYNNLMVGLEMLTMPIVSIERRDIDPLTAPSVSAEGTPGIKTSTSTTTFSTMWPTTNSVGESTTMQVVAVSKVTLTVSDQPTVTSEKYVITTSFTTMWPTTDSNGQSTTVPVMAVSKVTLDHSPTGASAQASQTPIDGAYANPNFTLATSEAILDVKFSLTKYYTAMFAAPLVAVIIKGFAEVIVASFKLVEPFHCLSRQTGAPPEHSITAQYLSSSISLDMFRSLRDGRLITIWSTTMFILLTVAAPLAATSMSVAPSAICVISGQKYNCNPKWIINTAMLRSVEVILALCVALVISLIVSTWKYYIGLGTNPSAIASIMSLMNHKAFVGHLQQLNPDSTNGRLQQELKNHRFWMGEHEDQEGGKRFGIMVHLDSSFVEDPITETQSFASERSDSIATYIPLLSTSSTWHHNQPWMTHKTLTNLSDTLHLLTALTLFVLTITYYFNPNYKDIFNVFFNSRTVWPKLVLVGLASIVDMEMKDLERVVRITEPYRRLSKPQSRVETTLLLPLNGTCWSNLPQCAMSFRYGRNNHMVWQTWVSIIACLSDLNIIAAAGVPFSSGMILQSYQICVYTSLTITGLIIATVLATMTWWRKVPAVHGLPKQPSTIGAVCSYLCASKVVQEWVVRSGLGVRLEGLNEHQMRATVIDNGQKFWFGRMAGEDGKFRWAVDMEKESYERLRTEEA